MEEVDIARFRGLNMNHGFVRYITRNQIDRDEYDKVMEERRAEVREKVRDSGRRSRKEPTNETPLYVPPHKRHEKREQRTTDREITKEESNLRQKVRSRTMAQMDKVDDLIVPSSSNSGSSSDPHRLLFTLNMRNNHGEEVEVPVLASDKAAHLAKSLGRKHNFTEEQCRNLRMTLEGALEAHLGKS